MEIKYYVEEVMSRPVEVSVNSRVSAIDMIDSKDAKIINLKKELRVKDVKIKELEGKVNELREKLRKCRIEVLDQSFRASF